MPDDFQLPPALPVPRLSIASAAIPRFARTNGSAPKLCRSLSSLPATRTTAGTRFRPLRGRNSSPGSRSESRRTTNGSRRSSRRGAMRGCCRPRESLSSTAVIAPPDPRRNTIRCSAGSGLVSSVPETNVSRATGKRMRSAPDGTTESSGNTPNGVSCVEIASVPPSGEA